MPELIIIVGLPGSGKSTRVRELRSRGPGLFVEDFMKGVDPKSPIRRSPRFTDSRYYAELITSLRKDEPCVIADIIFCDTLIRLEAEQILRADVPRLKVTWEFFENAPAKCLKNAEQRARESLPRERRLIKTLSERYFIPVGVKAREVITSTKSRITKRGTRISNRRAVRKRSA